MSSTAWSTTSTSTRGSTAASSSTPARPFIQHEWQAEAGGPIIKDKTFFYASWVAQKIPLGFFKRASVPSLSYFATGGYFSPAFSGSDPSNTNTSGGLPDRIAEANLSGDERTKEQWFDPSAFVIQTAGRFGNSGVNTLVGQGINAHHLSLAKRFRLSERFMFTFTGALSNLFNHPHFNNPRNNISNPNPGKFESVVPDYNPEKQTNRRIMLKLRLEF